MSKHQPPTTSSTTTTVMTTRQITDILPSYISLYQTQTRPPSPSPDRTTILKWFTTLSPPQRVAYLTVVDTTFTNLLLRMLRHINEKNPPPHSHVTFFLLPDIPSRDPFPLPYSLLTRRSRGLLSRVAYDLSESTRVLTSSLLLYSSVESATSSTDATSLDTVSFREAFISDVEGFINVMDTVSGYGFLNGSVEEWGELGLEFPEMGWLKRKGYYSLEEFVGNRIEVALRMAWLNANSSGAGRRRGVKLKEKARNLVGLGVNVYWRKRGCVDWWERLDHGVKLKVFRTVLGKSSKSLIAEITRGADGVLEDGLCNFGTRLEDSLRQTYQSSSTASFEKKLVQRRERLASNLDSPSCKLPTSLVYAINRLIVLQAISTLSLALVPDDFEKDRIFFSFLDSVGTISDGILRKMRGLLMVVSLDFTKFELLEEDIQKPAPCKHKEKSAATHRKKKGKTRNTKKLNGGPKSLEDGLVMYRITEDSGSGSTCASKEAATVNGVGGPSSAENLASTMTLMKVGGLQPERQHIATVKKGKQNKKNKLRGRLGSPTEVQSTSAGTPTTSSVCVNAERGSVQNTGNCTSAVLEMDSRDSSICCQSVVKRSFAPCNSKLGCNDLVLPSSQPINLDISLKDDPNIRAGSCLSVDNGKDHEILSEVVNVSRSASSDIGSFGATTRESNSGRDPVVLKAMDSESDNKHERCCKDRNASQTVSTPFLYQKPVDLTNEPVLRHDQTRYNGPPLFPACYPSYEWPAVFPLRFTSFNSQHLPPATDRLHLEVGHNWQNHFQHSFIPSMRQASSSLDGRVGRIISQPLPGSLDWPPMLQTCNYDSTFLSRQQAAAGHGFTAQSPRKSIVTKEEEKIYSKDCHDLSEQLSTQEVVDEYDSHWISEEEYELHAVSSIDYNQYFGGGVMYWDPSDYRGSGFSRPPSLSSDDSSWAWREADMNRTVDDMVACSTSYSANGLNSPSAAPFCSPFESMPPGGHQAMGYVRSGNEGKMVHNSSAMTEVEPEELVPGPLTGTMSDGDAKSGDSLPYPILRPIIIPSLSRDRSRAEFKGSRDLRSPRVPPNRREHPRIKRPPSPVVLCVPHAPRPPPPSPVGDSKKHRGFPTVRSGSSSPRHWGVRGWFHDGANFEESCVRVDGAEVVWPSWGNTKFTARQVVQPLPGAILQDHLIAISQLTHDLEHPDVALPLQPPELSSSPTQKASLSLMQNLLHEEIDSFCKQVAAENVIRRPYVNWAVKRVTRSLQVLWPRSRTNIFGSNATGLSLPTSDVDLVVSLPPVRNLEPIKEAGILEGRNSIKETCLQHAARYLGNQEWVKADSLKTVENTAIPIIMLVVDVPHDVVTAPVAALRGCTSSSEQNQLDSGQIIDRTDIVGLNHSPSPTGRERLNCNKDSISVRLDISFKSPSHTGLQTTELVKQLTDQFPAAIPLALVLKQFLADRSLDQSYSGGLSSYCLVLLITRFLQHEHHHGRSINQNLGGLFMEFLYFYGNVFDPRQMRISIRGSGLYINRERVYSIDPIYIDDPLFPTNNVGRNCFRIHQCIKAFADAYSTLENELICFTEIDGKSAPQYRLLPKIISSLGIP